MVLRRTSDDGRLFNLTCILMSSMLLNSKSRVFINYNFEIRVKTIKGKVSFMKNCFKKIDIFGV